MSVHEKMVFLVVDDSKISRKWLIEMIPPKIMENAVIIEGCNGEEAVNLYTNVFPESEIIFKFANPNNNETQEETIMFTQFTLSGNYFNAMSGEGKHQFDFNESISFIVNCDSQEEIDYFWEKLGKDGDPKAQQCGWLKDKFGVSWQIVPAKLSKLLSISSFQTIHRPARRPRGSNH